MKNIAARVWKNKKARVAVIVVFILIAAGAAYLVVDKVRSAGVSGNPDDGPVIEDRRAPATQNATSTADTQAFSGDVDGAYATLDTAIKSTDKSQTEDLSSLYQTRAIIAWNAGQKDAAITAQQSAIAIEPKNYRLVETLGDIYNEFGDKENANKSYDQARTIAQENGGGDDYHGIGSATDRD